MSGGLHARLCHAFLVNSSIILQLNSFHRFVVVFAVFCYTLLIYHKLTTNLHESMTRNGTLILLVAYNGH